MDIAMGTAPNIDLVVHVVEMWGRAECRSQRGSPLIAVDAARRIVSAGLIEDREVGVVWIRSERRNAIGLQAIASISVVRINRTLRAILRDGKTPVTVRSVLRVLCYPGQHDHRHEGMASRRFTSLMYCTESLSPISE